MSISDLPTVIGAVLVLAGIVQIFVQMFRSPRHPDRLARGNIVTQSVRVEPKRLEAKSAYPGITMICAGVALLLAGHFFPK